MSEKHSQDYVEAREILDGKMVKALPARGVLGKFVQRKEAL